MTKKQISRSLLALLAAGACLAAASSAEAQHHGGGGGGGGGGWHGGGGGGWHGEAGSTPRSGSSAWHGGGAWHGGVRGGGWGFYGAYGAWPYWGLGWGLGYPYGWDYYGEAPYPYLDADSSQMPAVGAVAPPAPNAAPNWYYCDNPAGYYPYVKDCSGPWRPVPAMPPAGQQAPPGH